MNFIMANGVKIEYELVRGSYKNINLRVRKDGSVRVSASKRVPLAEIESFIRLKSDFVLNAIDRMNALEKSKLRLENGVFLPFLGKSLPLSLKKGKNSVVFGTDSIELSVTNPSDEALCEKVFDKGLLMACCDYTYPICVGVAEKLADRRIGMPEIKVRKMKSRYGSCNSAKKIITLASALVCYPPECVEYVIYHEFSHFFEQNHSERFYAVLSRLLPDWQIRRTKMRGFVCPLM